MYDLSVSQYIWRLTLLYLADWTVVWGMIGFGASISTWATPRAHAFSLNDASISHPFAHRDTVSGTLLFELSILVPGLVILVGTLLLPASLLSTSSSPSSSSSEYAFSHYTSRSAWKRRAYAFNTALLGLALTIALVNIVTDGLKNFVGRPRPDLLERCGVREDLIEAARVGAPGGGLVSWDVCGNRFNKNVSKVKDGFRSWPSGHSSMSFAGLTYTALFLAVYIFRLRSHLISSSTSSTTASSNTPRFPTILATFLSATPLCVAGWVATSRYGDYRHHGFDIISGSVIGAVCACVGWGVYGGWCCEHVGARGAVGGAGEDEEKAVGGRGGVLV